MSVFNDHLENRIHQLEQKLIEIAAVFAPRSIENIDQAERFLSDVVEKSKNWPLIICVEWGRNDCVPVRDW